MDDKVQAAAQRVSEPSAPAKRADFRDYWEGNCMPASPDDLLAREDLWQIWVAMVTEPTETGEL